jgi:serine/threonine protein phosphatase 1
VEESIKGGMLAAQRLVRVGRNPSPGGRDLAVGDIHGCFTLLEQALARVGFDESVDRLFSVGDLVDRGPESERALEFLAKPWFKAVMGNHEFMALRAALGDPYQLVSHRDNGGAWLDEVGEERKAEIAAAFMALPVALEVEGEAGVVGLIHADCPFDNWADMAKVDWSQNDMESKIIDECLWGYERFDRNYQGVVKNIRAVVHGHISIRSKRVLGNVHYIDTGGWRGGSFTLLDLATLADAKPSARKRG